MWARKKTAQRGVKKKKAPVKNRTLSWRLQGSQVEFETERFRRRQRLQRGKKKDPGDQQDSQLGVGVVISRTRTST